MKNIKEYKALKAQVEESRKQKESLDSKLALMELADKLESIPEIIQGNKTLCERLLHMPRDEARIVLADVINSTVFIELFDATLNKSEKLAKLRKSKALKAEKRKASRSDANKLASAQTAPSEAFTLNDNTEN
ncbi:MAG: hypothetical protein ACI4J7_04660 [Ruminiclostridium sp.]